MASDSYEDEFIAGFLEEWALHIRDGGRPGCTQEEADLLEAAVKRLRGPKSEQWIPVTKQLPKHMQQVIVQGGIAYWRQPSPEWPDGQFFTITAMDWPGKPIQWDVTHWMPMPESPLCDCTIACNRAENCKRTHATGSESS